MKIVVNTASGGRNPEVKDVARSHFSGNVSAPETTNAVPAHFPGAVRRYRQASARELSHDRHHRGPPRKPHPGRPASTDPNRHVCGVGRQVTLAGAARQRAAENVDGADPVVAGIRTKRAFRPWGAGDGSACVSPSTSPVAVAKPEFPAGRGPCTTDPPAKRPGLVRSGDPSGPGSHGLRPRREQIAAARAARRSDDDVGDRVRGSPMMLPELSPTAR